MIWATFLRMHLLFLVTMILDDGSRSITCSVAQIRLKGFDRWPPTEAVSFELLVDTRYHYEITGEQSEDARFGL